MDLHSGFPFSHTSKFVDLLNSQHDNEASDHVLVFSTQCTQPSQIGDTNGTSGRKSWSPYEDVLLISSWLNTSKDPIVGNDQRSRAFWKRIASYYANSLKPGCEPHSARQCKQRWHKMNDLVCKFCGAYETDSRDTTSGQNDNDMLKVAHQIFFSDQKKFNLEHAWNELKNDQKWAELSTTKTDANSKKRRAEESSQSPTGNAEDDQRSAEDGQANTQPPGVKAAKAKGKKVTAEANKAMMTEFERMWACKEKELAMKRDVAKMGLLDFLMKKETLNKREEGLKQKLLTDLMST
ncbi:glutathione S-transferase T3-like [Eutrema salsugineum]|uniref:glutathione S-transferase T3-like n=1 Tax=Eutrema salsugineum TaxID=72664 RepID=UPI000CED2A08|nr:glutathione S-transferase T3-like [Eutrema salsugineum]